MVVTVVAAASVVADVAVVQVAAMVAARLFAMAVNCT